MSLELGPGAPTSYLICATPRTGSTLLCDLLRSTHVAGSPESFFREQDEEAWATRFNLAVVNGRVRDYAAFVAAAAHAGASPNGVFSARIMWGSIEPLIDRLSTTDRRPSDAQVLVDAFGTLRYIHVRREDVVAQAVSWARAEQTGFWQRGDVATANARLDYEQVDHLVRTIHQHNEAWSVWFAKRGVEPYLVTYESLVSDPAGVVKQILAHLGLAVPEGWAAESSHRRQADELNLAWAREYRRRSGLEAGGHQELGDGDKG